MGDSILTSLSLPPSGRLLSNQPEEGQKFSTDPSHDTQHRSPFIAPVFGTILNKDVPFMSSKRKGAPAADPLHKSNECEFAERPLSKTPGGIKRRQPDISYSEEEEEVFAIVGNEKKERTRTLEDAGRRLTQDSWDHRSDENEENGAGVKSNEDTKVVTDHLGVQLVHLAQDPSTCSPLLSSLHSKPRVVLNRVSVTSRGGKSLDTDQEERRASELKPSTCSRRSSQHPKFDVEFSGSRNKE